MESFVNKFKKAVRRYDAGPVTASNTNESQVKVKLPLKTYSIHFVRLDTESSQPVAWGLTAAEAHEALRTLKPRKRTVDGELILYATVMHEENYGS